MQRNNVIISFTALRGHEQDIERSKRSKQSTFKHYQQIRRSRLKKHDKGEVNSGLDTSFPYPPGFTPEKDNLNIDVHEVKGTDQAKSQSRSKGLCSRILEETQSLDEHLSSEIRVNGHEQKKAVLSWRF
nr:RNA-directed DNA polymerase, eukaryota [Tanacetum cinerariifolium]